MNDDESGCVKATTDPEKDNYSGPDLSKFPLPPGWDMGVAQNGRVYFIDHVNAKTTWVSSFFFISILWRISGAPDYIVQFAIQMLVASFPADCLGSVLVGGVLVISFQD